MCSLALVLAGCGTLVGKAPDPEELVAAALESFKVGMETQNVEKVLAYVSDDFEHYEWGDKDTLGMFLEDTMAQGDLDDAEITFDDAEYTMEEGAIVVYPVELIAVFGSATIEFTLKKDADGVYRVSTMEVEGV
jgi:hypothetical protein